jgi:tetratricopeptide (TPR) repeat protein
MEVIGNKKQVGDAYFEIADDLFVYGTDAKNYVQNFPVAIDYFLKATKAYEAVENKYNMARSWLSIARVYAWQNFFSMGNGNVQEIEKCASIALKLFGECKEKNETNIATCIFMLGRAKYFEGKYAEALNFFFVSLKSFKDSSNNFLIANNYLNIGRAYKGLGDSASANGDKANASKMFKEALSYFELGLGLFKELKYDGFMAFCYLYMGTIQINFKQFAKAKDNLEKAITYTDKLNGSGTYQEIYQSLAKTDSAQGNYLLALKHYNMYMGYKESSSNNASIFESLNYKKQYEFDKKEDSLKQKQLLTETKLQAQKKQRYFYWAGLALLAILSFFIFLTFRNQKKINRLAGEIHSKEKAELELQSLRAQLNPHFMFNSLNAIQELILLEENEKSQSYLARFSKLLRMLLENAERPFIPLQREIDFLQLYLSLENLRIPDLHYTINVDPSIDTEQTAIPNMILQPYIENAIWHGLSHKKEDKNVQVRIIKTNGIVQYEIEDNGAGRKKSDELKSLFRREHKSKGMELLSKRFKLLSKEYGSAIETSITDVMNNGEVAGTLVTIKVPAELSLTIKNQQL